MADGSDGEILISADGSMSLNGPGGMAGDATDIVVNSGTAITRLVGNGTISQTDDGLITAATLGVRQNSATPGFNINLCEANVVGTFAANNASDGFISFQSTQSFTTGSVPAATGFAVTTGVTTTGGFIELQSGGDLTIAVAAPVNAMGGNVSLLGGTDVILNAALNTGTGDLLIVDGGALNINQDLTSMGTIRLQASGAITQTNESIITADELGVRQVNAGANMDIILTAISGTNELNAVNEFAAQNLSVGGQVEFLSGNDLTLGGVTVGTGKGAVFTAVNGVTTTAFGGQAASFTDTDDRGDILIETRGSLTLAVDDLIDGATGVAGETTAISAAGGMSDVRLVADEAIAQDQDGLIIADELGVRLQSDVSAAANENIALGFGNTVNEVAIVNTSAGGTITFQNSQTLRVGDVAEQNTTNSNLDFTATSGATSIDGDITITTNDGNVGTNNASINVNALVSSIGAGADINDGAILISADGTMSLDFDPTTTGVGANTVINSGDAITRLVSNGSITQDTDGLITADSLGVRQESAAAGANIDLCEANVIDNVFAANNASTTGFISFRSTQSFTTGTVAAVTGFTESVGVTTQGGSIALRSGGTLTIADSDGGSNDLDAAATGAISLIGATDVVLNEALNAGTGAIFISDGGALDVDQALTTTTTIRLQASGDITQSAVITAGELGVRQIGTVIPGGDPNMTDVEPNGFYDIILTANNAVNQFAADNDFAGGQVEFLSLNNLTVGNVAALTVKGITFAAVGGVTTAAFTGQTASRTDNDDRGDILLETRSTLTLNVDEAGGTSGATDAISAAGGLSDARLIADGIITQDTDGLIVADELGVRLLDASALASNEDVMLGQANTVNEVAVLNQSIGGAVTFQSINNLTVGVVTDQATPDGNVPFATVTGVSTTSADQVMPNPTVTDTSNDVLIEAGGSLFLDEAIDTNNRDILNLEADVRLIANGDIAQDAQGVITADELGVLQREAATPIVSDPADRDGDGSHDVDLGFNNNVDEVAINNAEAGAEINFQSTRNLTVGSVGSQVVQGANFELTPAGADAVTGVVSASATGNTTNDITIEAEGFLNLDDVVNTDRNATGFKADVRLLASGDISQDAGGLITANELGVLQRQNPHVPANDIGANDSQHDVDLGEANDVDEVAIDNAEVGAEINFRSTQNLTVGSVAARERQGIDFESPALADGSLLGVVSTSSAIDTANEITIQADGSLNLDEAVNTDRNSTGFVADVRLIGNGDIAQDAEGIIIADELGVLQSRATHAAANDIVGSDTQHDVDLGFNNQVNEVAISNVEAGAEINFHSTQNLVVGSVAAKEIQTIDFESPTAANAALMGVVSTSSVGNTTNDILIEADQSLTLDLNNTFDAAGTGTAVNSGMATTRLVAQGDIRQDADGLITADALGVRQNRGTLSAGADLDPDGLGVELPNGAHDIDLGYVNSVNTFAATNAFNASGTGAGVITFQNDTNLIIGTVSANPTVDPGGVQAFFANTVGVSTTNTGAAVVSRDSDGDGTFETLDDLSGDILIDAAGSLSINSTINAAGGNSDARLAADGAITQTAIITANELNVRQDVATADTHITLTLANMVDEFAAFNAASEGDVLFTDADNLNINALVAQAIPHMNVSGAYTTFATNGTHRLATGDVAIANVVVGSNGGDITITAENDLSVVGVTASTRTVFSANAATDNGVEMAPSALGEDITLQTNNGNISFGQNVIITTDEDTTMNVSSVNTEDDILIQASSDNSGSLTVGAGVQVRTDGGVALDFTRRPTDALSEGDFAFFSTNNLDGTSKAIKQTADSGDAFGNAALPATFYAYDVTIGVSGEENLEVTNNFRDPTTETFAMLGLSAAEILDIQSRVSNSASISSDAGLEALTVTTGGSNQTFGHVYSSTDVNTLINSGDARLIVPFSVSHHSSIQIQGAEVTQNGTDTVEGNVITNTDRGAALFNLIRVAIPPVIEPEPVIEPNPAPPNPEPVQIAVPLTVVNVEAPVASRVGVSSQSFDYFQLRRNEGEAGYEIIDEQISEDNGESLLDPRTLKQYVDDNNIPDEQDYELWLITTKVNNAGQSVTLERPILKFDVSGGRPIPAIEDLPMEFPELRLEPIPLDGDAEVEPVENSNLNEVDPESDKQEVPEKVEEEQDAVSLLDETDQIQRIDGSHQASAIGVGSVLAVSNLNRKKSSIEGRRVRNASLLSRIFGGKSSN